MTQPLASTISVPAIFLSLILALAVCPVSARVVVTDDLNVEVAIERPAIRVIALAPHLTELLFSLGVGDRIVGTSRYSDYPEAAKKLKVVGDAFSVSVEAVVELQPDLIFAWATGGANRPLKRLKDLGFVIYVNEVSSIDGIGRTLSNMAALMGKEEEGLRLVDEFQRRLSRIRSSTQDLPAVDVFFQISDQSLYTVNRGHLIGQAIDMCNGNNVFADQVIPVPLVSQESVLIRNPDVLVISRPESGATSPWIRKWGAFEGYKEKIRWIDPGQISRPSLRMLDGIEQLCMVIQQ